MKYFRIILTLVICATFTLTFAQNAENKTNSNGKKQGYWKKYDEFGLLQYEGNFNNGVPVGTFTYYYNNGKVKSITTFIQGTHKVHTVINDNNGNKASEGNFIDQIKDSVWNYYNDKGTLIKTESYKKGKKHGAWKTYSAQTGILLDECTYDNDQLNGTRRTYFTDGKISTRTDYINGEMNGVVESYFPNEKIYYRGTYLNGLQTGSWDYYDESGRQRKTEEYKRGGILRTFIYLKVAGGIQKINQDNIAYFHREGNNTRVTMADGKAFLANEIFDELMTQIDFIYFYLISPNYLTNYNNIVKYYEVDANTVTVILDPETEEPVVCKDDYAKGVKMLFNRQMPKE